MSSRGASASSCAARSAAAPGVVGQDDLDVGEHPDLLRIAPGAATAVAESSRRVRSPDPAREERDIACCAASVSVASPPIVTATIGWPWGGRGVIDGPRIDS